jgi:hypothetical protein
MSVRHLHDAGDFGDRRGDAEALRKFWIAFVLAVMTSFGVAASMLAFVAAGLALFA